METPITLTDIEAAEREAHAVVSRAVRTADGIDAFDVQAAGLGRKLIDDAEQARTNAQLSDRSE